MTQEAKNPKRPDRSQPKRVPLSQRNRMTFNNLEPGYKYRVVNDVDSRIANALEGGYEFVESDEKLGDTRVAEGSSTDSRVSKPVGNGITGFLMRIREDWYKEDQLEKKKRIDKTEEALHPQNQKQQGSFDKSTEVYGDGLSNK